MERLLTPFALAALLLAGAANAQDPLQHAYQKHGPLEFEQGDVICLLGNATAERMQHHGWLETALQLRFPDKELVVRNLGFSADELDVHQRTMNFGKFSQDGMAMTLKNERFVPWDRYLDHCDADVIFAFFGFNESFQGPEGLPKFRENLESFIDHVSAQNYSGDGPPELVLVGPHLLGRDSSLALEDTQRINVRVSAYDRTMNAVADAKDVRYVSMYLISALWDMDWPEPVTINGHHLTELGNERLSEDIQWGLFGSYQRERVDAATELRAAILEKNRLWFNRYRATDGYNTYGGRSRMVYKGADGKDYANFDVMQREMDHIDVLVANRDKRIHALARGEDLEVDDSNAPPLLTVSTNKPGPRPDGAYDFTSAEEAIAMMTPAPGMQIDLFADERQFPELVNPAQMAFDTRGRLWVAVWPSYPHWRPDEPFRDKLIILEDTDGDGRADKRTVFADDLHNPTGFEFWNGGVLLAAAPDILFLEDTDGDDRADQTTHMLHGLSSADSHHSANSFVLGPDGALYFQEGTFHMSQVESVYGPVRNRDGCVWRFDPRTFRVERYIPYNFANPHGHCFDRWGQDFVTDGTGNVNYYALPFSGFVPQGDKHRGYFPFFKQRSRPSAATEFLSSRHFPEENQGNYLIANVIGFRGIFQYEVNDDGAGFGATEVAPIVESTDPNFRPVDIEIGPDGAIYFLDWHNPIIGHLQHHIRDPSRDKAHGRIYRVTYKGRPLLDAPAIDGQPIPALLELLKSPEDRTRYQARIELSERDARSVLSEARRWGMRIADDAPNREHHLLELLWLGQRFQSIDPVLLRRLLRSEDHRVRAAATRVLRFTWPVLDDFHPYPELDLIKSAASDPHPRVRLEAVVAASFHPSAAAAGAALEALKHPTDKFIDYALQETMRALEPEWQAAVAAGELPVSSGNEPGIEYLVSRADTQQLRKLPRVPSVLQAMLRRHGISAVERMQAARDLAQQGSADVERYLLGALNDLDQNGGAHADHVIADLMALLAQGSEHSQQSNWESLALAAQRPATRAHAFARLVAIDQEVDHAWGLATKRHERLLALLDAVGLIADPQHREALYTRIRVLASTGEGANGRSASAQGLAVTIYQPAPADARRETLAALIPQSQTRVPNVTLALDALADSDSFGLSFSGSLTIDTPGEYTFFLTSDDGSRLYLDGAELIENDGPHGMVQKSGTAQLTRGSHDLLITFFEQGGAEGLKFEWAGPGFERQAVPADRLLSDSSLMLREAAIRALAHVPGHEREKLGDAVQWLEDDRLLGATVTLLRSIKASAQTAGEATAAAERVVQLVDAMPLAVRTTPRAAVALQTAAELVDSLPADERVAAIRDSVKALGAPVIVIRTLPHQMLYDLTEFTVEAGKPLVVVFENNDMMPHNLVIAAPGSLAEVGEAAELLTGGDFIPAVDSVLWHTKLLYPGESFRLAFKAPQTPGDYPFVCTYPGHWRVMNGTMRVVANLTGGPVTKERSDAPVIVATPRKFVRDWTMAELEPLFDADWQSGRSHARGKALFTDAGCIGCHTVAGEGNIGGPELTAIRDKYGDADLLRHVIEPTLEILDGYEFKGFELKEGGQVIGRVVADEGDTLLVATALLQPENLTTIAKDNIEEVWPVRHSPMPTGLLVTFEQQEILDLVWFLQGSGEDWASPTNDDLWVEYEGTAGLPGNGKHIALLAGDEEYRSEEALPMLARILAVHHGFDCTVLFATNPDDGTIDPEQQTNIPGMHLLADADMLVCFLRFRELPDEQMKHFVDFVESGKPILGIRTATHAFSYSRNTDSPYAHYDWRSTKWPGGFGQQVLGDTWINHHGSHGSQSTRGVTAIEHPILRGVDDVWGPTDVYGIKNLPADATVLLHGQVLDGMQPDSQPAAGKQNNPMMPLVWLRELDRNGSKQRIVASTIGAAIDCQSAGLRRLFVNACYWGLGLEAQIAAQSRVDTVGAYQPTFFGFGKAVQGRRAGDHALDDSESGAAPR